MTEEAIGAIVQATGFTTYDIARLPELGGGQANVTLADEGLRLT